MAPSVQTYMVNIKTIPTIYVYIILFIANCCATQNASKIPSQCQAVINIPTNDPVYLNYNKTCMSFNRALTSANFSCPLIPATFVSIYINLILT